MFVARFIHDLYNYTWNALRASSFYDNDVYFIFIRVSFRIRIKTLDLFRACHGIDIAHFLFV